MGKRKPTSLHVVDGTYRNTRANPAEPQPPAGIPQPPAYLTPVELAAWRHFAAEASGMRVLTTADAVALEQLACAWAEAQRHRAFLREHGDTYKTVNAQGSTMVRPRPEVRMLRDASREVLLLLGRFGLTPADRPAVSAGAAAPDPTNPDEEFTR